MTAPAPPYRENAMDLETVLPKELPPRKPWWTPARTIAAWAMVGIAGVDVSLALAHWNNISRVSLAWGLGVHVVALSVWRIGTAARRSS